MNVYDIKRKIEIANFIAYKVLTPLGLVCGGIFLKAILIDYDSLAIWGSSIGFFTVQFWIVRIIQYKHEIAKEYRIYRSKIRKMKTK